MMVAAVVERGVQVGEPARAYGISRKAVWNFAKRYERGGAEGLKERSRRPLCCLARISDVAGGQILRLREIKRLVTRPYTPKTNRKVERFFGTLERELLRLVRFSNLCHRREALSRFASHYNLIRPHSAIGFSAPTPYRINYFNSLPDVAYAPE